MSKKVTLLRPFVLSSAAIGEQRMPREKQFMPQKDPQSGGWVPTEIELTDEEANHDYIKTHFADNAIERPEVTAARIKGEQAARQKKDEDDARELKKAEDAVRRASGAHAVHQVNEKDVERQLNTPVNQLSAEQGKGIDKPIDEKALALELNTPVNELQAGKAKK